MSLLNYPMEHEIGVDCSDWLIRVEGTLTIGYMSVDSVINHTCSPTCF